MSAVLVTKENNRAVFTVEVPNDTFKDAIAGVYQKNKQYFSVPGFRKGRVPQKIVELNYGKEIFYDDALNDIIPGVYEEAVKELELQPVDQPDIDVDEIKADSPIKLTFEVDLLPVASLGDTDNLTAEVHEHVVEDEDIERELEKQLQQNARKVNIDDREAKEADIVTIDFKGLHKGEAFEGGSAEGYELTLGSNTFIPGFEEQIIGHKVGDDFEVEVTFPEDYQEESLAGEEVVFEVTLHGIQEEVLPELDDEFVKDISEFDTLEEYKKDLRSKLEKEFESREKMEKQSAAIEALIEVMEVEIPESMIRHEVDREMNNLRYQLQGMGLDVSQYFELIGQSEEDVRAEMSPQAERNLLADFALTAYTESLEIEISEEELEEKIEEVLASYGENEEQKEIMRKQLKEDEDRLKEDIKRQHALDKLVESVEFTIVTPDEASEEN